MLNLDKIEADSRQDNEPSSLNSIEISSVYSIHNIDARKLDDMVKEGLVDVTITSPPYFDLKDYGHKDQIGYGQQYDQYLKSKYFFYR